MTRLIGLAIVLCLVLSGCARSGARSEKADASADADTKWLFPDSADPMRQRTKDPVSIPPPQLIEEGERSTLIYTCRHAQSETLREATEGFLSAEGVLQASNRLNRIIITDSKERVGSLLKLLDVIDKPVPQILVEARVVEVTLDSDLEYEIKHLYEELNKAGSAALQTSSLALETPGSNPNTTLGARIDIRPWSGDDRRLDNFIRLLITKGKARILSSPNLMVALTEEGSLITGEEVPIQSATVVSGSVSTTTVFKRVGIKLRVIPTQITNDTARIDVIPEVSTVTGYTAAGASGVSNPIVAIRSVRTALSVKDGEVLSIGGLLRDEDRQVKRAVPVLGDIPILGWLFTSRRDQKVKTQLVFFLRVRILPEGEVDTTRVHKPGSSME